MVFQDVTESPSQGGNNAMSDTLFRSKMLVVTAFPSYEKISLWIEKRELVHQVISSSTWEDLGVYDFRDLYHGLTLTRASTACVGVYQSFCYCFLLCFVFPFFFFLKNLKLTRSLLMDEKKKTDIMRHWWIFKHTNRIHIWKQRAWLMVSAREGFMSKI